MPHREESKACGCTDMGVHAAQQTNYLATATDMYNVLVAPCPTCVLKARLKLQLNTHVMNRDKEYDQAS